jgi:hypothetical protein
MVKQSDGSKYGQVICHNCGYEWYPNARLWRNISMSNGGKVLYCPACAVKNKLTKDKLREVIKRSALLKSMRAFANG